MTVFADKVVGTIGGGHVEFEAIAEARALLNESDASTPTFPLPSPLFPQSPPSFPRRRESISAYQKRYVLGPSLGQCCGGVMTLRYEINSCLGNKYAGYNLIYCENRLNYATYHQTQHALPLRRCTQAFDPAFATHAPHGRASARG